MSIEYVGKPQKKRSRPALNRVILVAALVVPARALRQGGNLMVAAAVFAAFTEIGRAYGLPGTRVLFNLASGTVVAANIAQGADGRFRFRRPGDDGSRREAG
jgi:hypothetical protein